MTVNPFDDDRPPELPRRRGRRDGGKRGRRGRRGDPNAVVPDVQFDSYYGRQIVKPAPWKHEISVYFFTGGLAASSALLAAGADLMVCVGSSLEVFPVAELPSLTLSRGGALAIVTEGPTPFDDVAAVRCGADVADEIQRMDGVGRFAWVTDPEGNRIELWQPT